MSEARLWDLMAVPAIGMNEASISGLAEQKREGADMIEQIFAIVGAVATVYILFIVYLVMR